ncbi:MAG: FAD-dependent oxidoreductase, partial [Oscillospiraceae bacterium]|nr:FAD-dependent oxidoreductase [Oscillospiraceae bacterium]
MKTIVIGGGAAGCFAAVWAARQGQQVCLIEKNDRIGKKLRITGKGRCNVTNNCDRDTLLANIPRGGRFLYSAFAAWSPQDTMAFFEELGVPLKTERGNRVFPVSDQAAEIVETLRSELVRLHVEIVRGRADRLLTDAQGRCTGVHAGQHDYHADRVIL